MNRVDNYVLRDDASPNRLAQSPFIKAIRESQKRIKGYLLAENHKAIYPVEKLQGKEKIILFPRDQKTIDSETYLALKNRGCILFIQIGEKNARLITGFKNVNSSAGVRHCFGLVPLGANKLGHMFIYSYEGLKQAYTNESLKHLDISNIGIVEKIEGLTGLKAFQRVSSKAYIERYSPNPLDKLTTVVNGDLKPQHMTNYYLMLLGVSCHYLGVKLTTEDRVIDDVTQSVSKKSLDSFNRAKIYSRGYCFLSYSISRSQESFESFFVQKNGVWYHRSELLSHKGKTFDRYSLETHLSRRKESETRKAHILAESLNNLGVDSRLYGLEIEIVPQAEKVFLLTESYLDYINSLNCSTVCDASIPKGVEIVTPPLPLDGARNITKLILDDSHTQEFLCMTERCGLHIHVSRKGIKEYDILHLQSFLYSKNNSAFIDKIAGRNQNRYCARQFGYSRYRAYEKRMVGTEKMMALNLMHKHTIEFRLFAGTMSHDVVCMRLEFIDSLIDFVQFYKLGYTDKGEDSYKNYIDYVLSDLNPMRWAYIKKFCKAWRKLDKLQKESKNLLKAII